MDHRKVPAPFKGKRDQEGKRICPWCGKSAREPQYKQRVWHPECVKVYLGLNSHRSHFKLLLERDGDKCRKCSINKENYQIDHILPLWLVDREKLGWETYFTSANLQLLCTPCHSSKTAREASQRAKIKRIQGRDKKTHQRAKFERKPFSPTPVKQIS